MLLQQHHQHLNQHQPQRSADHPLDHHLEDSPASGRLTDEEVLVWCYTNANSEFLSANNALEIIVNLCSCSAKDIDLAKVIRSQIQFVSDQLSNKSYQTVIHSTNDYSSSSSSPSASNCSSSVNGHKEADNLRITNNLLLKKYRLLSVLSSELTNCRCECADRTPVNANISSALKKSEFNCKMWFRQIKVIETKLECDRQSLPFDVFKVVSQLLDTNQLNINSIPIALDFNNNNDDNNNNDCNGLKNCDNNDMKIEKFPTNDCSVSQLVGDESYAGIGFTANEYSGSANENSFGDPLKNMQILRYDSLLSVNEATSLALEDINNNEMTTNGQMDAPLSADVAAEDVAVGVDVDVDAPTFQELQPISANVGLNYSVQDISHLIRSNAALNQEFDYPTTNCSANASDHFQDDILPQITAIEIDQILNT